MDSTSLFKSARKLTCCLECGEEFDDKSTKVRLLPCGHHLCGNCRDANRRKSKIPFACMLCNDLNPLEETNKMFIQMIKAAETAKKTSPRNVQCSGCAKKVKENEITICHTCSEWNIGNSTEEIVDFAGRPITSLICFECSESNHKDHAVMSKTILDRLWNFPEAKESIQKSLNKTNILVKWNTDGGLMQLNKAFETIPEKLQLLEQKVSSENFSISATNDILLALKHISSVVQHFRDSTKFFVYCSRSINEYLDHTLKFMEKTVNDNQEGSRPPNQQGRGKSDNEIEGFLKKRSLVPMEDHMKHMMKVIGDGDEVVQDAVVTNDVGEEEQSPPKSGRGGGRRKTVEESEKTTPKRPRSRKKVVDGEDESRSKRSRSRRSRSRKKDTEDEDEVSEQSSQLTPRNPRRRSRVPTPKSTERPKRACANGSVNYKERSSTSDEDNSNKDDPVAVPEVNGQVIDDPEEIRKGPGATDGGPVPVESETVQGESPNGTPVVSRSRSPAPVMNSETVAMQAITPVHVVDPAAPTNAEMLQISNAGIPRNLVLPMDPVMKPEPVALQALTPLHGGRTKGDSPPVRPPARSAVPKYDETLVRNLADQTFEDMAKLQELEPYL